MQMEDCNLHILTQSKKALKSVCKGCSKIQQRLHLQCHGHVGNALKCINYFRAAKQLRIIEYECQKQRKIIRENHLNDLVGWHDMCFQGEIPSKTPMVFIFWKLCSE